MKLERARTLIRRFARQRIVVAGDLMLDRYVRGTVERISPEAPVPVVRVSQESNMPGGAANVAMNVRSLGGQACVAGCVGRDPAGEALLGVLESAGISTEAVVVSGAMMTIEKTRILAERQQVVRVDRERPDGIPREDLASLVSLIRSVMDKAGGAVIEDYGKGTIVQPVVDAVIGAAGGRIPVGYDPKENHELKVSGITLATPNCREAHVCAGLDARSAVSQPARDARLRQAGRLLMRKWGPDLLIITLGPQGMYLVSKRGAPQVIPTRAREVFDVSGAGDTVIAASLLALAAGASHREAAMLGNYAAGVVVGKIGTATCSPDELLACMELDERDAG